MVPQLQLQGTLDSTRLDLQEQLQQLSSRSSALCQAVRGAVDLLLHGIRTMSQAASSLPPSGNPGAPGDAKELLLSPANAEAIAALVDLTVSEVHSLDDTFAIPFMVPLSGRIHIYVQASVARTAARCTSV